MSSNVILCFLLFLNLKIASVQFVTESEEPPQRDPDSRHRHRVIFPRDVFVRPGDDLILRCGAPDDAKDISIFADSGPINFTYPKTVTKIPEDNTGPTEPTEQTVPTRPTEPCTCDLLHPQSRESLNEIVTKIATEVASKVAREIAADIVSDIARRLLEVAPEAKQEGNRNGQNRNSDEEVDLGVVARVVRAVVNSELGVFPTDGDILPTDGDILPTDEDILPTDEDILPTDEDILPTDGDILPTAEDILPTDGDILPTDGDILPTDGDILPTDGDILPTDGDILPTDGTILSSEGDILPTEDGGLPTDSTTPNDKFHIMRISNATEENAGLYICQVKHYDNNVFGRISMVHVIDICKIRRCQAQETCVADYETGLADCFPGKDMTEPDVSKTPIMIPEGMEYSTATTPSEAGPDKFRDVEPCRNINHKHMETDCLRAMFDLYHVVNKELKWKSCDNYTYKRKDYRIGCRAYRDACSKRKNTKRGNKVCCKSLHCQAHVTYDASLKAVID